MPVSVLFVWKKNSPSWKKNQHLSKTPQHFFRLRRSWIYDFLQFRFSADNKNLKIRLSLLKLVSTQRNSISELQLLKQFFYFHFVNFYSENVYFVLKICGPETCQSEFLGETKILKVVLCGAPWKCALVASEKMRASKYFQFCRGISVIKIFPSLPTGEKQTWKNSLTSVIAASTVAKLSDGWVRSPSWRARLPEKNPRLSDRSSAPIKQNKHELRRPLNRQKMNSAGAKTVRGRQRCQKLSHYGYRLRRDFGKWRRASLFSYLLISVLILPKFVEHQLKLGSKLIKIWVSRVEFLSFTRVLLIHIINDGCCSADSSRPRRPRPSPQGPVFLFAVLIRRFYCAPIVEEEGASLPRDRWGAAGAPWPRLRGAWGRIKKRTRF